MDISFRTVCLVGKLNIVLLDFSSTSCTIHGHIFCRCPFLKWTVLQYTVVLEELVHFIIGCGRSKGRDVPNDTFLGRIPRSKTQKSKKGLVNVNYKQNWFLSQLIISMLQCQKAQEIFANN
jgi:hypothetical protein